jgi:hypothetical protein
VPSEKSSPEDRLDDICFSLLDVRRNEERNIKQKTGLLVRI